MSSIPARVKKIQIKIKTLERSQDFSHYKSMWIFPDAQGQVTLQSMVGSGQILNSSKTLKLSLLHAKMKKIRSKMKALEFSQHYTTIFPARKCRLLWSWWWYLADILTFSSFHACPPYLQERG